ncbi:hypothetical protein N7539_000704 [Penicillium diatomitis]|uniref:BHLH domain-containing protein n=1 Tax=Penicillium diatomitis TaxID=2819901 RepID=A0A9W9XM90_9EURO|nr:uncharacterized protein N7539_000704 [Penicillium diatomitis]KAJ5495588.1 hypothetical protein N7539_000704 [Penicillium diatomitis]
MNHQPAMTWPEQIHDNQLITAPGEDEFSNFLEFNMQFTDLDGHGPSQQQHSIMPTTTTADQTMISDPRSHPQFTSPMEGLTMDFSGHPSMQSAMQQQPQQQQSVPQQPGPLPYSTPAMTPGFCAQDTSSHHHQSQMMSHQPSQQQHQQPQSNLPNQQYMHQNPQMIPPTPNSIEMHGNATRYPQRVDEHSDMYDRYSRINEEQALYTPLVSPAMTPLESQFRLPEYTIPGEYFTPLTSPALEAQHSHSSTSSFPFHARQVSDVGFVPTTAEVNPLSGISAPSSPSILRKTRRRPSAASSRLAGRASKSRQSPHIRAQTTQTQRMRGKPFAAGSEDLYGHMASEMGKLPNHDVRSLQESSNEGSGQDSVSPEPLPDSLMPPPAVPPSRKSPAILPQLQPQLPSQAQQQKPQQEQQKQLPGAAATPATLMRLQRSQHAQESSDQLMGQAQLEIPDEIMEDISLPEAAQPRPKVGRIDTAVRTAASPSISAHGTPSIEPRSNPSADRKPVSVAPSPRTLAMPSPSGPLPKRSDPSRASISSRKRPSVSSTHASPLLRPKISPSIQPLMRGSDSLPQDALYLASKSNYQHILDGTLPSGVSYPETLAENLSSKRTNHKLAEQGRRNRINNALKEIESLIPPEFIQMRQAKEAAMSGVKPGEKDKDKPANQVISKASAVEMAIDYIKALKKTLEETSSKLIAAESKLNGGNQDDTPRSSSPAIPVVDKASAEAPAAETTTKTTTTTATTTTTVNGVGSDSSADTS